MSAKTDLPSVPAALADVAMIDGPTCAAAASISLSNYLELVRTKKAPQPAIRQPRCTRWRIADVRAWLIERAQAQTPEGGADVVAHARKASAAAKSKRAAERKSAQSVADSARSGRPAGSRRDSQSEVGTGQLSEA